jgi:hypothetical protein
MKSNVKETSMQFNNFINKNVQLEVLEVVCHTFLLVLCL